MGKHTALQRFWLSWYQPTDDYRPLAFPPNEAILGWWCTGYECDSRPIICALVQAESLEAAWLAVRRDWPEFTKRFQGDRASDYVIRNDRFPLSDWMRERMGTGGPQ